MSGIVFAKAVVVVVAAGGLGAVDGPGWGVPGGAVGEFELPLAVVEQGVVSAAEQGGVVEVGVAALVPGGDVVGFAPGGWGGAVRVCSPGRGRRGVCVGWG